MFEYEHTNITRPRHEANTGILVIVISFKIILFSSIILLEHDEYKYDGNIKVHIYHILIRGL